jgi:mono/diheme cytochrome c family protein
MADDVARGRALAQVNCGRCHAIEATGDSPFKDAPPFRGIRESYTQDELEDAFNEGVAVTHPAMPEWSMTPDQARQLAAFILSLK